MATFEMILFIQ